ESDDIAGTCTASRRLRGLLRQRPGAGAIDRCRGRGGDGPRDGQAPRAGRRDRAVVSADALRRRKLRGARRRRRQAGCHRATAHRGEHRQDRARQDHRRPGPRPRRAAVPGGPVCPHGARDLDLQDAGVPVAESALRSALARPRRARGLLYGRSGNSAARRRPPHKLQEISMKFLPTAIAVLVLAGCASFDGRGLAPGTPAAEVERVMGPAADKRVHDGETWLYFPRQPYGQATYVARIDRDGRLIVIEQRITDDNLARIVPGKTRLDEVRELFGPPYTDTNFQRMQREILEYRMRSVSSPVPYAVYVQASPDGIVREVYKMSDPDYRLGDCCNP